MKTLESRLQKRIHVSIYALLFLTVLLGLSLLLEGCADRCELKSEYVYYEPVYTTLADIRDGIGVIEPQPIMATGKIYFKGHLLFVNEPGKGIHVIDDQDPAKPQILKFITIPGNFDLAIKGNILYADSYTDLVALDISSVDQIKEVGRLEGVFTTYNSFGFYVDTERGVVTRWERKSKIEIEDSDCEVELQPWGGFFFQEGIAFRGDASASFLSMAAISPGQGSGTGVGGSLARFTISGNHLYMLNGGNVETADISAASSPVIKTKTFLGWDIETIFPYKNNLFVGARSGMHIVDISVPETPVKVSTYQHVVSCDPVVVDENYAYVTLRSGTPCQGFSNQLEVIDIKDLNSPKLLKTYLMHNPHGLGIDQETLFVCDGDAGLKIYNAADKLNIDKHQLASYRSIHAYDVIPFNNVLMMIGRDGIFQYDYTNPSQIKLLSHLAIQHED